jgi:hypothetical protein
LIPVICIILLVAIGGGVYFWFQSNQIKSKQDTSHQETQVLPGQPAKTFQAIPGEKVIDYNRVDEDENLQAIIQERKKQFGLDNGVDVIVRSRRKL